jgi:hypothetical protein
MLQGRPTRDKKRAGKIRFWHWAVTQVSSQHLREAHDDLPPPQEKPPEARERKRFKAGHLTGIFFAFFQPPARESSHDQASVR